MGLVMVLQWPISFYSGGLLGLQRQVLLNGITVTVATLRGFGAVFILWLVSPTIQAFFIWQLVMSALNTFLVVTFLWRSLPPTGERARFEGKLLQEIWRFAAGMSGISLMALILMQLDKVILSKLLTLEMFGYYTLAGSVATILTRFFGPLFIARYPRFTQLVSQGDEEGLKQLYHRGCQLVSVLVLPVAVVMAVFSKEILLWWTQNPATAAQTAPLLSLLVIGTALNGMMNLPYALKLAYGWTPLAFYINVVTVAVLGPVAEVLLSERRVGQLKLPPTPTAQTPLPPRHTLVTAVDSDTPVVTGDDNFAIAWWLVLMPLEPQVGLSTPLTSTTSLSPP
jgi:O-antigen/teichoic acid export membrane protein